MVVAFLRQPPAIVVAVLTQLHHGHGDQVSVLRRAFFDGDHAEVSRTVAARHLAASDVSAEFVAAYFERAGAADPVDRALRLDTEVMLVDDPVKRLDSMTMAWGLEARVPFLDLDLLAFTMSLPPRWRAPRNGVAKHLLRTAFEGWLPDDLLWRSKQQFGDGSGVAGVLADKMAATVTPGDLAALRRQAPVPLRDAEEAAYYRFFAQTYGTGSAELVAQFATTSQAGEMPDGTRR